MSDHIAPLLLPFAPAKAAAAIHHRPRWIPALAVVILVQILLEVLAHPVMVEETLRRLPESATNEERAVVRDDLDTAVPVDLGMIPIKEAGAVALGAVVLGLLVTVASPRQRPRAAHLVAVLAGIAIISGIEKGAETAFLSYSAHTHGLPAFPWSALAFVHHDGLPYAAALLLTIINLFTLWYVVALGRALAVLCNVSTAHAVLIALVFRAASAGCTIALLHLLRNAYAFTF